MFNYYTNREYCRYWSFVEVDAPSVSLVYWPFFIVSDATLVNLETFDTEISDKVSIDNQSTHNQKQFDGYVIKITQILCILQAVEHSTHN